MTKSIWVIATGEYSDYRVFGAFSSKENAERVLAALDSREREDSSTKILEWQMDPIVDDLKAGRQCYAVHMLKDGTVMHIERYEMATYQFYQGHPWMTPWVDHRDHSKGTYMADLVWAKDDKHAIKIVNERRLQMIANNEWRDA